MTRHLAQHPTSAQHQSHDANPEHDASPQANPLDRSSSGGTRRRGRSRAPRIALRALLAASTLAAVTVLVGTANAAPTPRPDDLQLGGWVTACAAGQRPASIDYYTDRAEHGRADVVTGPAGTRYAIFLHRDGRGGETVTLTVHCAGRRSANHITAFHVPGPGNNTEFEHGV